MFRRPTFSVIVLLLILTTLFWMIPYHFLAFSPISSVIASDSEANPSDSLVILVDHGHGQFFNASTGRFSQALAALQFDNDTIIKFCTHQLNNSILSGVDVLIITNPAENPAGEYAPVEKYALKDWFRQGNKGLFVLSNPYLEDNATLSGNSDELRRLLLGSYLPIPDVDIREDIVKLDFPERPDNSILSLDIDYSEHWIFNQSMGLVNKTVTQSCSVEAPERGVVAGRAAYSEDTLGKIALQKDTPEIISMTIYQNTSRLVLSGSTIMFSDLPYNSTHSWYETADNSILWQNIVLWLAGLTPMEEVEEFSPPLSWEQVLLVIGLGGGSVFVLGLVFHVFGVLRPVSVSPTTTPLPTQRIKKKKVAEREEPTKPSKTPPAKKTSRRQRQLSRQKKKR